CWTGVGPGNGGNQAQRKIEIVFGLEVAPIEHNFPAQNFVSVDFAGLDQFFELVVTDLQAAGDPHDGHGSWDHLIALVGDRHYGFGDASLLNLWILKKDLNPDAGLLRAIG